MPAAWLAHDLHHEAWKRSTRTFLPMRERESKGSPPVMRGTCTAGAAGAAAPEEGTARRAARATAGTKRLTAHSIGESRNGRKLLKEKAERDSRRPAALLHSLPRELLCDAEMAIDDPPKWRLLP